MKVLLTGAAGFIGSAVRARLRAPVTRSSRSTRSSRRRTPIGPGDDPRGVLRVDVRSPEQLAPLLDGVDVVCHQAAMVGAGVTPADLPLYAGHNDLGTAVLLAAMADAGVGRFVLASLDGRLRRRPLHVSGPRRPGPATSRSLDALRAGSLRGRAARSAPLR